MKENEKGRTCSLHGPLENTRKIVLLENVKKKHLGDLSSYGRVIIKWTSKKECQIVGRILLA